MLLNTNALPGSTNINFYINQSCWLLTQQPEVKRNYSQWRVYCVETRPKARRQKWKLDSNVKQDRENELEIKSSDFFFFKMVMSLLSHIIEKYERMDWREMKQGRKFHKQSASRDNCQYFRFYFVLFYSLLFCFFLCHRSHGRRRLVVIVIGIVELASHIRLPHAVSWLRILFSSSASARMW